MKITRLLAIVAGLAIVPAIAGAQAQICAAGSSLCAPLWATSPSSGAAVCATSNGNLTTSGCSGGAQIYPVIVRTPIPATALTAVATWQTLVSPSITLGTSTGPTGAWNVRVEAALSPTGSGGNYVCITGTNGGTGGVQSTSTGAALSAPCNTSSATPTNPLAGGGVAGTSAVGTFAAVYTAQYPNGTSVSFNVQALNGASTPTVSGYVVVEALPV